VNPEIKKAQLMKVPYMLVVGDREMGNDMVAIRKRIGVQAKDIPVEEFIADLRERIVSRSAGAVSSNSRGEHRSSSAQNRDWVLIFAILAVFIL
jgi:hypothetical protein